MAVANILLNNPVLGYYIHIKDSRFLYLSIMVHTLSTITLTEMTSRWPSHKGKWKG